MSAPNAIAAPHAAPGPTTGWRGVALVAITYIYFLIFAQFAFLQRLSQLAIADTHLKAVMAAMAFGGILFSLLTPRLELLSLRPATPTRTRSPLEFPRTRLQLALIACAAAALLTLLPLTLPAAIVTAFLIGTALGTLTVTLVTHLNLWTGTSNPLLKAGLGTGLGYFLCNFPPLFTASPQIQALTAATLCLAAVVVAAGAMPATPDTLSSVTALSSPKVGSQQPQPTFPLTLLAFTALIWLDSAAFYIIQTTPTLKANTWQGTTHLYLNATLHLLAALASVALLRSRGLRTTLAAALLFLATACLLLSNPQEAAHRAALASLLYPIGVSLYSVALVAYPAILSNASSTAQRARQAGLLYALGGWFGSAMGIGMGQHLGHVPALFVLAASALILLPTLLQARRRELLATTAVLLPAAFIYGTQHKPTPAPLTPAERGRQVYIAEGCINCHSQYIRPNTHDVALWGPVQTLADLRAQRPPLIGNRRQGPDLSNVALRRNAAWLRAHQINPASLSANSIMPSYAYLFREPNGATTRGDDLVAYLQTLHPTATTTHGDHP